MRKRGPCIKVLIVNCLLTEVLWRKYSISILWFLSTLDLLFWDFNWFWATWSLKSKGKKKPGTGENNQRKAQFGRCLFRCSNTLVNHKNGIKKDVKNFSSHSITVPKKNWKISHRAFWCFRKVLISLKALWLESSLSHKVEITEKDFGNFLVSEHHSTENSVETLLIFWKTSSAAHLSGAKNSLMIKGEVMTTSFRHRKSPWRGCCAV